MNLSGNTILITGGGSGIGRALAESFHQLGNQVIIAGRGNKSLDETTQSHPGMQSRKVDMTRADSIKLLAAQLAAEFPSLNAVIHCAGVMLAEDLLNGKNFETADSTITTNLLGTMRLTEQLLPTLRGQPSATIVTVSSGLAFIPSAIAPSYCASKAAIHSYTQTLRYQLRETHIQVIELIPPYVATTLLNEHQAKDPNAMPLAEYISETMDILKYQPDVKEVLVKRVHPLRFAEHQGPEKYEEFFEAFNEATKAHIRQ